MPNTEEIRKTITSSTAVHVAAGTVDLAAEKLRRLPSTVDKLRAEAPGRIQSFREHELPRLRQQAQSLAQQGAEVAREYAAKARETYGELAERGRGTVEEWSQRRTGEPGTEEEPKVIVERVREEQPTSGDATAPTDAGPDAAPADAPAADTPADAPADAAAPAADTPADTAPAADAAGDRSDAEPAADESGARGA